MEHIRDSGGRVEALECKGDSHKVDDLSRGKNLTLGILKFCIKLFLTSLKVILLFMATSTSSKMILDS